MIPFERFSLDNGLKVLVHQDKTTPMVSMNILYDVGARDENPNKTGFAHLFEHLMFGGSKNIPIYDEPLQNAGGENNAYTTNDITNYYLTLPKKNLETAFWLESDRMMSLAFGERSLEVQRKVVCEEFKENYINKPYGDVWKHLRELCYKVHPYQWMTIGKELSHIEDAQLQDVKDFFFKHYRPKNAILSVAGNVELDEIKSLSEKWFAPIESGTLYERNLPKEPEQMEERRLVLEKDVPVSMIYKAWHIDARSSANFYTADVITEVLAGGKSSRLYKQLVKEQALFSQIDSYHLGSIDEGLLLVAGSLAPGVDAKKAEAGIEKVLRELIDGGVDSDELAGVKNKVESMMVFEDLGLGSRANNLAFFELLGDAAQLGKELGRYAAVTSDQMVAYASKIFKPENSNTLWYLAK